MISPILPPESIKGADPTAPPSAPAARPAERVAFASELAASERAEGVDVQRAQPPAELLDEMAAAGRVYDQLQSQGRELRFELSEPGAGVRIELHDSATQSAEPLGATQAFDIAAGNSAA